MGFNMLWPSDRSSIQLNRKEQKRKAKQNRAEKLPLKDQWTQGNKAQSSEKSD
eukprot:m.212558 g.212558  ORF g.212558 m.212558 type:complete len:53 (+) comp39775_c0_seq18:3099-3257(+)